jgi:ribose 5-phosphate isomerase B
MKSERNKEKESPSPPENRMLIGVAANKIPGVRAALITDSFSAHQGVEDDDMNIMCLGGRVTGYSLSWELVQTFISARFQGNERFIRRLKKISDLETKRSDSQSEQ